MTFAVVVITCIVLAIESPLAVIHSGIFAGGQIFLLNPLNQESKMHSTGQMDISQERVATIRRVHRAFSKIMKLEQCRTCSCFYADMMGQILEVVRTARNTGDGKALAPIENDFQQWLEEAKELDLHG